VNYFAHGCRFVADPYFLAGTALPDWLSVVDRRVRIRSKQARPFVDHQDISLAKIAQGVAQHHADDEWFHGTRAFAETSLQLTVLVRGALGNDAGLRPSFLGHILVELLLDWLLIEEDPARAEAYYQALAQVAPQTVQSAASTMAPRPAERLAEFIPVFRQSRFLFDYADDGKLCYRLNQVMSRVGLPALVESFCEVLPAARAAVAARRDALLRRDG
jgi:hypothetical protein